MSVDEKKLDEVISNWREKFDAETARDMERFTFDIEKHKKEQKRKKLKDRSALVSLCLACLAPILETQKWTDLFFTILPFLAITTTTILVIKSNKRLKSLDLGLSLAEYQTVELQTLKREYRLLKKIRWFFFPMMTTYALFNIFCRSFEGWERYVYPSIYAIAFVVMILMFRWGIGKFQDDIDAVKRQMAEITLQ